jgi:hypothetical protein
VPRSFRILVWLAVGFAALSVLCVAISAFTSPLPPYLLASPASFTAGVADLVRTPALTFTLLCAVGAVFVRALTWHPGSRRPRRAGGEQDAVSAPSAP